MVGRVSPPLHFQNSLPTLPWKEVVWGSHFPPIIWWRPFCELDPEELFRGLANLAVLQKAGVSKQGTYKQVGFLLASLYTNLKQRFPTQPLAPCRKHACNS